uniref:SFRICE_012199 n=1 Tax=Spodoptera frugiperda TaxID=7108 RepID=A0A2H1WW54_SPOFR
MRCQKYTTPIVALKIAFRVRNIKPNSIPFSSYNMHAIQMQWVLVLQFKSTINYTISMSIEFKIK